jgi:hypothetical protein
MLELAASRSRRSFSGNSRRSLPFTVRGNAAGWKRPPYRISIIAKCSLARKIDCGGLPSHNPLQVRTK